MRPSPSLHASQQSHPCAGLRGVHVHVHAPTHTLTNTCTYFIHGWSPCRVRWGEVSIKVVEMMSSVPNLGPFLEVHQIKSESMFFTRYSIREAWRRKFLLQVNPYLSKHSMVSKPNCPSGKFKLYSIINLGMHLIIKILNLSHIWDLFENVQIWFLKRCYQGMLALFHRGQTEPKLQ